MRQRSLNIFLYQFRKLGDKFFAAALLCGYASAALTQVSLPADFSTQTYVSGIYRPVDIEWAANGTLFVGTKKGLIWVVKNGVRLPVPFIDIQDEVNGTTDRGMLGIETHPNFPATPYLYLLYTYDPPEAASGSGSSGQDGKGQRVSRLIRVTADAANNYDTVVPGSAITILGNASIWSNIGDPAAEQTDLSAPWACGNDGAYIDDCIPADGISHTIGTVAFGPDGMLYISSGDGASYSTVDPKALRSLNPDSLGGKILRIDPDTGQGLATNPFWDGNPNSNRSRVWNTGLRNPYRFIFDPNTDKLWIGNVGWGDWEELYLGTAGADFGWPCYEGGSEILLRQDGYEPLSQCQSYYLTDNAVPSTYGWEHVPVYGGAIIVGDVYTGTDWPLEYRDAMFFADYATEEIFYAKFSGDSVDVYPFATGLLSVDIALGPDGQMYSVDVVAGEVNRIVYQGVPTGTVVGSYASDFVAAGPATGWAYKWNAGGALDDPAGYAALLWDGTAVYDSDGVAGLPDATAMNNGHAGPGYMYPGKGVNDGEADNRYAIAEFTVAVDGVYSIVSGLATHTGCLSSDGVQVATLVDGAIIESRLIDAGNSDGFNKNLGYLYSGSVIAVAVGPNSTDLCDETDINWSITHEAGTPPVGNAPVPVITSPSSSTEWVINDVVNFTGTATDTEDGTLTGSALQWEVTVHHNEHQHPDFYSATGTSGSISYPDHDDNSYLEICLIATDSDGRSGKNCIDARPDEVEYTFDAAPTGLDLTYNGRSETTPFSVAVPAGGVRQISAPSPQGTYLFDSWSIGGPATQQILIGNSDLAIGANFQDLGGVPQSFEVPIAVRENDAEESVANNEVTTGSSDLEMTLDGDEQIIGLRFTGIPVNSGAVVTDAWVQFTVDETGSVATSLLVEGELGNSLTGFSSTHKISTRTRTTASVAWNPPPWTTAGEAGADQRTSNLAPIINEIFGTPGWAAGDAITLIISGSGKRVAESFDGTAAPVLHVEYLYPNTNMPPLVTITAPAGGATVTEGTSINFTATALDNEDGDISSSVVWVSSLDGALGSGNPSAILSVGAHLITASATDSDTASGSDSVTVTVTALPPNTPPVVSVSAPADGITVAEGTSLDFVATASDTPDGDLSSALSWASSKDGALGTGGNVTATLTTGTHTVSAGVTDSGSLYGSDSIVVHINAYPTATITSPADGTNINAGTGLSFTATASDAEDGDLATAVVWNSSLDGVIGNGATADSVVLSAGIHLISATVSDSGSLNGSDSITIVVNAVPTGTPPVVTILAPLDGITVNDYQLHSFVGTAIDIEDGDISAGLNWSSSIEGDLPGPGATSDATLSKGVHTVTASITDSGLKTGSAAVEIKVVDEVIVIDIIPGDAENFIPIKNRPKPIPVAILTTSISNGDAVNFDSAQVNGATLQFGPAGAAPTDPAGIAEDVDADGDLDKKFIFIVGDTGIACEDTEAELTGDTFSGELIQSSDYVTTPVCPSAGCHP